MSNDQIDIKAAALKITEIYNRRGSANDAVTHVAADFGPKDLEDLNDYFLDHGDKLPFDEEGDDQRIANAIQDLIAELG